MSDKLSIEEWKAQQEAEFSQIVFKATPITDTVFKHINEFVIEIPDEDKLPAGSLNEVVGALLQGGYTFRTMAKPLVRSTNIAKTIMSSNYPKTVINGWEIKKPNPTNITSLAPTGTCTWVTPASKHGEVEVNLSLGLTARVYPTNDVSRFNAKVGWQKKLEALNALYWITGTTLQVPRFVIIYTECGYTSPQEMDNVSWKINPYNVKSAINLSKTLNMVVLNLHDKDRCLQAINEAVKQREDANANQFKWLINDGASTLPTEALPKTELPY